VCAQNAGGAFKKDAPSGWRNVLLVTSHPDDESMFFGPTIQTLHRLGAHVHVLCLSNGGADGLGAVRTNELEAVQAFLGIRSLEVVDDPRMRDGFDERWPAEAVAARVEASVRRVAADVVLTFDARGVSGHPNHTATYRGVLFWMANNAHRSEGDDAASPTEPNPNPNTRTRTRTTGKQQKGGARDGPPAVQVWVLVSTNVVRKFLMTADVFASFFLLERQDTLVAATNPTQLMRAMSMHESQWVWYRKLFILFSRYSYVNSLKHVTVPS
jgi:N-acetylglucosaminylphosphatidylinositol deacetylase